MANKADKNEMLVLSRLANILTSENEVRRRLDRAAVTAANLCFEKGLSAHSAKVILQRDLMEWMNDYQHLGHGTSKLVSKAIGKALKGYEARMRRALEAQAAKDKKERGGGDFIRTRLAAGQIGKHAGLCW